MQHVSGAVSDAEVDDGDEDVKELEVVEAQDLEAEDWGDAEDEADEDWVGNQRELLTSVLDYNLKTLSDLVSSKRIDLSPRYQRRDRWKADRQSRLIESFLMNVPVPPIFLNEDDYGKYSVIDGKQRLTAVHEFLRGRLKLKGLKVYKELNGLTIDHLSPPMQAIIETRANLRATIILRQSDKDVKFEVFRRLNTGGISLNPQEIRNSTWPGPFNDLLLDLSEIPRYKSMLGATPTSAIYKEMRDVELTLRFFTFRKDWDTFSGGMAKRLDAFMSQNQRTKKSSVNEMQSAFLKTIDVVEAAFGSRAFRRFNPETKTWRPQVVAALFDAQMFAVLGFSVDEIKPHRESIEKAYSEMFSDSSFRKSIDAATNTPALFRERIQLMRSMLERIVSS